MRYSSSIILIVPCSTRITRKTYIERRLSKLLYQYQLPWEMFCCPNLFAWSWLWPKVVSHLNHSSKILIHTFSAQFQRVKIVWPPMTVCQQPPVTLEQLWSVKPTVRFPDWLHGDLLVKSGIGYLNIPKQDWFGTRSPLGLVQLWSFPKAHCVEQVKTMSSLSVGEPCGGTSPEIVCAGSNTCDNSEDICVIPGEKMVCFNRSA